MSRRRVRTRRTQSRPKRYQGVEGDLLSSAVCRAELRHFKKRHPAFSDALISLQKALAEAFLRHIEPLPHKSQQLQEAVFFLGHQATDDFFDIVLLATHGYGVGALKLLRPLYERVVSALYLIKYPDEVQDFNDYADVDGWRLIRHAKQAGADPASFLGEHQVTEIKNAYDRVKPRFTAQGRRRERRSWAREDLAARAKNVGLDQLYGAAAWWPTMLLHTTRASLEERLTTTRTGAAFTHEPQRQHADWAIRHAHDLIVLLLHSCNEFFGWGLDVRPMAQDVLTCWDGPARPRDHVVSGAPPKQGVARG